MSQYSAPQQGILTGDATLAPYDADEWALIWSKINGFASRANFGVVYGYDNGTNYSLEVTQVAVASSNVEVKIGSAQITGTLYWNDATVTLPVGSNASGNPRIDTVVLRKDYVAQTIRLAILQGSPAGSPVAPTLTQSATTWEIPLADIAVANGFSTILDANITPRHQFLNEGNAQFIDGLLNNSGGALSDGDVVIWDSSASRAVTTTTTSNHWKVAGVWRGVTANGSYGRIQTRGFGKVNVRVTNDALVGSASIGIGTPIVTGYAAKKATTINIRVTPSEFRGTDGAIQNARGRTGSAPALLGYLMQSTGSILGTATYDQQTLCYIDVQKRANPHKTLLKRKLSTDAGTFTSGSWVTRTYTHMSHGAELDTATIGAPNTINVNNYLSVTGGVITLQPGRYFIRGWSAGYRVDGHLTRLQDTTNAATIVVSQPAYSPSAADSTQSFAELATFLIVETATNYELQARCTTTKATDGMGKYVGFSSELVTFTQLEIDRIDEVYT